MTVALATEPVATYAGRHRGDAADESVGGAVKVGDFFVSSWGYDQTNVDFYCVVEVSKSGKTVKVQEWCQQAVTELRGHPSSERVIPGDGPRKGGWRTGTDGERFYDSDVEWPVTTHRLRFYDSPCFTVNSYSSAYLWTGEAKYQTATGWGH